MEEDEHKEKYNISVFQLENYFRNNPYKPNLKTLYECVVSFYNQIKTKSRQVNYSISSISVNALKQKLVIDPTLFRFEDNFPTRNDNTKVEYYGRKAKAKELHKLFKKVNLVSLVAIGGTGKTFFAHKYKEMYSSEYNGNILHVYLNNNIIDDFVECMDRFINNKDFSNTLHKCEQLADKINGIVDVLKQTITNKILLILDINVTDKEQFEKKLCKINFLDQLTKLSQNGMWNILLLSRLSFKVDSLCNMSLSGFEDEPKIAVKMFRDISGVTTKICSYDRLIQIFSSHGFYFHPLLISVLASYCRRASIRDFNDIQDLMDEVIQGGLPDDMKANDISIEKYLDHLIDFKSYESYDKLYEILLRHFILWEYNNIPYDIIKRLLNGFDTKKLRICLDVLVNDVILTKSIKEYRVNGMTIQEQCDMIYINNNNPEWKYVEDKEQEFVNKLTKHRYPIRNYVGYRMHGFIGDALRKKALESNYNYSIYINTISELLIAPKSTNELRNLYHNIYESLFKYNYILNAPNHIYLLMSAHLPYYPGQKIKEDIINKTKTTINNLNISSYNYADINNLAIAIYDYVRILFDYYKDDDVALLFCKKVILIREHLVESISFEENLRDNSQKLSIAYALLSCIYKSKGNDKKTSELLKRSLDIFNTHRFEDMLQKIKFIQLMCYTNDNHKNTSLMLTTESFSLAPIPKMENVIGGKFSMGCEDSSSYPDERPIHNVIVSSFKIGRFPITQFQWDFIMGDEIPSILRCDFHRGLGPNYPMYNITWHEAAKYCNKLSIKCGLDEVYILNESNIVVGYNHSYNGFRLPTEAEWEYAARGGEFNENFIYCGDNIIDNVAWYVENSGATTHIVGEKQHHNNLHLFDMSGNVWEWCEDWYESDFYQRCKDNSLLCNNPCNKSDSGIYCVLRGGSWGYIADNCRITCRRSFRIPMHRDQNRGFRIVCNLQSENTRK